VDGSDPDAVEGIDTKATPAVMARLKRELQTRDPATRRNAARLLGLTRSGAASFALVTVLNDDDAEVAKSASEGLAAIGGTRTCENLTKQWRNSGSANQIAAVAVLEAIAKKGPVDARTASRWLGRFVCSPDVPASERAMTAITGLGAEGGPGLVEALESKVASKRLAAIDAIGSVKYVRGARRLCAFLLRGDGEEVETYRARSMAAIRAIGNPAIPHLIDNLSDGRTKAWTGFLLREMTGQRISDDNPKAWREWYAANGGK
jgi:HEAT repeat protein